MSDRVTWMPTLNHLNVVVLLLSAMRVQAKQLQENWGCWLSNKCLHNCVWNIGFTAAKVQLATHKDIDEAISAAVKATPAMAAMASYERKAVLEKVCACATTCSISCSILSKLKCEFRTCVIRLWRSDEMVIADQVVAELRRRSEEIAHTLTLESGKPIKDSKGEVARSIDTFQAAAEESVRIYGEHMPLDISARNKGLQVLSSQILRCHAFMGGWESAIIGFLSLHKFLRFIDS